MDNKKHSGEPLNGEGMTEELWDAFYAAAGGQPRKERPSEGKDARSDGENPAGKVPADGITPAAAENSVPAGEGFVREEDFSDENARSDGENPAGIIPDDGENPDAPAERPEKKQGTAADLYDWLEIFAVSVAIVFFVFAFVARVAVVDGSSMTDTLKHGDKLLVRELLYTPKQGDIIVCQSEFFGFNEPLVKRVIATEGQTVRLDLEEWTVYVDGVALEEPYIKRLAGQNMLGWSYGEEYVVPEGHLFVMGDNRNGSLDSRDGNIGPIDERYVIGQVVFRFLPLSSFGPLN